MKQRVILHADCNSFYASVECILKPELNNHPMAVCGDPASRHGIILAKNERAKKFGVQTAETIWQAKRKCPELMLVSPQHDEYAKYSRLCNEIYLRFTDLVEPFGIDESFLDVTGSTHLFGDGETIADKLRETVRRELGLTISVGVSFNKVFAKLGSDYKKPDATTVITKESVKSIVFPLPASALLFVGRRTNEELGKLQIYTIGDLAGFDRELLIKRLGKQGGQIHDWANGRDDSSVASYYSEHQVKSVGNGATFEYDVTDFEDLKIRVMALCDSVGFRMRKKGLKCSCVQVSVKDPGFKTISRQVSLENPTSLTKDLVDASMKLIKANWGEGKPIRTVTVTASRLTDGAPASRQMSLFEDNSKNQKQETLQETVDGLRQRFGESSIGLGALRKKGRGR